MVNPERGAGWEIIREFVDPEIAQRARGQLLDLITSDSPYISEYPKHTTPPGQEKLTAYRFHGWNLKDYPDHANTITADPEAAAAAADIVSIHRRAGKVITDKVSVGQVNIFEVGGKTRIHRDRFDADSLAVSLLGVGLVTIKDPVIGKLFRTEVYPGDAMKIINPRAQRDRPSHRVVNISDDFRVSIVE